VGWGKTKDRPAAPFRAGIEALLLFYAPDVVCYPARGWVDDPVCHGHDGIRRLSAAWSANVDDASLEVHEVRDMSTRVMILAELRGRAKDTGELIHQPFGVVNSDLRSDGRVGVARFFMSWQEAHAAAEAA
jgi:hypothetical protein